MANQKTLTNWILAHRVDLDLRVRDCAWIREVFPGWHDLEVSLSVSGQKFIGRGSDQDADTALSKAFCEAVERSVCNSHGISSLGVAGHFISDEAKKNAELEFIERKALFDQVSNALRLEKLSVSSDLRKRYSDRGIKLNLYRLHSDETTVLICIADGLECSIPFGGILGLGADANSESAARKAIVECLRNLEAFLAMPSKSISYDAFKAIPQPNGFERQALFLNHDYFRSLMESFTLDNTMVPKSFAGECQPLEILAANLSSCPLRFFRYVPLNKESIQLDFVG